MRTSPGAHAATQPTTIPCRKVIAHPDTQTVSVLWGGTMEPVTESDPSSTTGAAIAMSVILFNHDGWEVATAAWSLGAKSGEAVTVVYQWGPDGLSWFDNATGTRRVTVNLTMEQLVHKLGGGLVDLREWT
jgi:hypothetical protein